MSGTSTRTYKQPIALDEAGHWNTHYAVYGTVMEGGGVGGGAVLGHMADGLDPLWPAAIRRWLPRWWTDRALRRQLTLNNTVDAYIRRLKTQTRSTNAATGAATSSLNRTSVRLFAPLSILPVLDDIEAAQALYLNLERADAVQPWQQTRPDQRDSKHAAPGSSSTVGAPDRPLQGTPAGVHLDRIDQLVDRSDATPVTDTAAHLQLMADARRSEKTFSKTLTSNTQLSRKPINGTAESLNRAQKSRMAPRPCSD